MKDPIAIDPDLDPLVVRARWEVLNLLRGVGRDERGVGKSLTTVELGELLEPVLGELGIDGKRIGQAGRWFANRAEGHPQWVLYWGNGNPARFGIRRECSNADVDHVIAAYTGRLAACALAREVDEGKPLDGAPHVDFDPGGESPEDRGWASAPCARTELERLEERRIGNAKTGIDISSLPLFEAGIRTVYDPKLVRDFVAVVEETDVPRSRKLAWFSELVSIATPTGALTAQLATTSEVTRYFANFSPWEKNNVLLQLADLASRQLRERAVDWACVADPRRKVEGSR